MSPRTGLEPVPREAPNLPKTSLWVLLPGAAQIRRGRRDVGLFFLGWCIGGLGIGVVIYQQGLPGPFWGLWAVACGFLWAAHLFELKRYTEHRQKLQRRQWVQLLFPDRPPKAPAGR